MLEFLINRLMNETCSKHRGKLMKRLKGVLRTNFGRFGYLIFFLGGGGGPRAKFSHFYIRILTLLRYLWGSLKGPLSEKAFVANSSGMGN